MKVNSIVSTISRKKPTQKQSLYYKNQNTKMQNDCFTRANQVNFKGGEEDELASKFIISESDSELLSNIMECVNLKPVTCYIDGHCVTARLELVRYYEKLIYYIENGRPDLAIRYSNNIAKRDARYGFRKNPEDETSVLNSLPKKAEGEYENNIRSLKYEFMSDLGEMLNYPKNYQDEKGLEISFAKGEKVRKAYFLSQIKDGKFFELKEKFPLFIDDIEEVAKECALDKNGNPITDIDSIYQTGSTIDFDSENKIIDSKCENSTKKAPQKAKNIVASYRGTGFKRAAKAVVTLGISEIIRYRDYSGEKKYLIREANNTAKKRKTRTG